MNIFDAEKKRSGSTEIDHLTKRLYILPPGGRHKHKQNSIFLSEYWPSNGHSLKYAEVTYFDVRGSCRKLLEK